MCSREPHSQATPGGDHGEKEYPRGTAEDSPEEEDIGNPEIRVPVKTKDGRSTRPALVEEDAKDEDRQWCEPPSKDGDERERE
ncbi:hypothetical protein NDU88_002009 [Pleurodeles waltl]|uniref:Uncharacterized protein n=1 Tax=Pleurodeles waltl TaxID=8319 RepID=A0AAV7WNN4_PLEWA|nr:hypothetical protein NDU88_002009 [Pleurodeles waltl]